MVFHHINAYEDNGHIVVDFCGFKSQDPLNNVYLKNLTSGQCESLWRTMEEAEPRRYVLPLNVNKQGARNTNLVELNDTAAKAELVAEDTVYCTWETLANTGFEFPQINYPHYNGKKYRYTYGVGWHNTGKCFNTIVKIDTRTKTYTEWQEEKCYPSEPVFVPDPNGTAEDDGVLLSAVNNSDFDQGKSAFLLVLDARSMTEIARAEFPDIARFPKDFHGDIPEWVCGSLYRNGPGMYEVGECKYQHWFDPLAMFQRFHVENKTVTYQNRYLQSETYKKNIAAQKIVVYAVGTLPVPDPYKNIFQRFLSYFVFGERDDNTVVNFFPLKDELYSATETNFIHKIDPDTLETLERVNLDNCVAVNSATAHPHYDSDGTVHNIGYSSKGGLNICLLQIPPKTDKTSDFPNGVVMSSIKSCGKMSVNYVHSFGMTEHFYVYVEQPMFINLLKILTSKLRGVPIAQAIEWWPTIKTRFRVVDKATGEEVNPDIRFEADPAMVFHHINAYEDNGHIVVDFCGYKSQDPLNNLYLKNLTSEQCESIWRAIEELEPRRYVLPLNINKQRARNKNLVKLNDTAAKAELVAEDTVYCTWETLANTGFEFPQINYQHYNGKKYRYTYGVGFHKTGKCFNTIIKIDTRTKTYTEWQEEKCYPSEPVFVADPNGTTEDDGILLSVVNNSDFDQGKSAFLLVLDAKSMTEIARAEFPDIARFPKDFHGLFRPDTA